MLKLEEYIQWWKTTFLPLGFSIPHSHKNQLSSDLLSQLLGKFKTNTVDTVSTTCRWPLPDLNVAPWFYHFKPYMWAVRDLAKERCLKLKQNKGMVSGGQQEAFPSIHQFSLLDVSLWYFFLVLSTGSTLMRKPPIVESGSNIFSPLSLVSNLSPIWIKVICSTLNIWNQVL